MRCLSFGPEAVLIAGPKCAACSSAPNALKVGVWNPGVWNRSGVPGRARRVRFCQTISHHRRILKLTSCGPIRSEAEREPQMSTVRTMKTRPDGPVVTIADLLRRLGNIPATRVRLNPMPGTATEKDVIRILGDENRPCELVEGTLVEKAIGYAESEIAGYLITCLNNFVLPRKMGIVTGESGAVRLFPGLVRIPDVAFASWDRFPGRRRPTTPVPHVAPDLVVEVLSKSNTKAEMARKLGEYTLRLVCACSG